MLCCVVLCYNSLKFPKFPVVPSDISGVVHLPSYRSGACHRFRSPASPSRGRMDVGPVSDVRGSLLHSGRPRCSSPVSGAKTDRSQARQATPPRRDGGRSLPAGEEACGGGGRPARLRSGWFQRLSTATRRAEGTGCYMKVGSSQ